MQNVKSMQNGKNKVYKMVKSMQETSIRTQIWMQMSQIKCKTTSQIMQNAGMRNVIKRNVAKPPGWLAQNIAFTLLSCHSLSFSLSLLTRDRVVNF